MLNLQLFPGQVEAEVELIELNAFGPMNLFVKQKICECAVSVFG